MPANHLGSLIEVQILGLFPQRLIILQSSCEIYPIDINKDNQILLMCVVPTQYFGKLASHIE